jgi:hypothetical protein
MTDDTWMDATGDTPGESGPGWEWTDKSLRMGSYVGYGLYQVLRDRLVDTDVPVTAHDAIIQELIDAHDVSLVTRGSGQATLACYNAVDLQVIPMIIMDWTEFPERLDGTK